MINIIPYPAMAKIKDGTFTIGKSTTIYFDRSFFAVASHFNKLFNASLSSPVQYQSDVLKADIKFIKDNTLKVDSYTIEATTQTLTAKASTFGGAFYALQTLAQIFEVYTIKNVDSLSIPCIVIADEPRFSWRGLLLDEARHFFGKTVVKKLLDNMAMHKLNVLHWHLSDDQSFRVEIKKYPLLQAISSKRSDTQIHGWGSTVLEGKPHEGSYSQDDLKEIVAYAKNLNISIVPEIDIPAHSAAMFASYPYLNCRSIGNEVPTFFGGVLDKDGDFKKLMCAGKESTYKFIFDIIDELSEIFPAPYFHIGGDEAPKDEWKKCPLCQKTMQDNNLANEDELQGYFSNRINEYLKTKGKRSIGWNEILANKTLSHDTIAQYWTDYVDKNVNNWLKLGNNIIMTKHQYFYFDMSYAMIPLKKTYQFKLTNFKITTDDNILGVEAPIWTEWVDSEKKLEFSLYPRLSALSEVCWTPEKLKSYKCFKKRLSKMQEIYDAKGIYHVREEIFASKGATRLKHLKLWGTEPYAEMYENDTIINSKINK